MKTIAFRLILPVFALALIVGCADRTQDRAEIMDQLVRGEIPEEVDVYRIDPDASRVAWEGTRVGSGHDGTIAVHSGEIYVFDGEPLAGDVVIDMERIVVLDIENPTRNAQLRGHLESDDFFSVHTYPTASFEITSMVPIEDAAPGAPNYNVFGNMTIKGITHGIVVEGFIVWDGDRLVTTSVFSLDRSMWDVRYGSGSFFDNLGDNMIHDNINFELYIVALP